MGANHSIKKVRCKNKPEICLNILTECVYRRDCIRGLGVEKLKRAYDILDEYSQEPVEVRYLLVGIMFGMRSFQHNVAWFFVSVEASGLTRSERL